MAAVLWIKSLHVIFMVTWFAGLFYLPRLFVYHTQVTQPAEHDRFVTMERKLYLIMTLGMIMTWVFGIATVMVADPAYAKAVYAQQGWLHAKLALALVLSGYHGWLKSCLRGFAEQRNQRSERFYRIINEVPAIILVAAVILVIVKPF